MKKKIDIRFPDEYWDVYEKTINECGDDWYCKLGVNRASDSILRISGSLTSDINRPPFLPKIVIANIDNVRLHVQKQCNIWTSEFPNSPLYAESKKHHKSCIDGVNLFIDNLKKKTHDNTRIIWEK